MEKIIIPAGTKQNIGQAISDLQDYMATNAQRRFAANISSYGISMTVKNGTITSDDFQTTQSASTLLEVAAGTAITSSYNYLKTTTPTSVDLSTIASGVYTLIARAAEYTDAPTTVSNGFLYNASGADTSNTRQHANVNFRVEDSGASATISGVYLADFTWDGVDTASITDRRNENILLLKDSSIDDTNIVKKDRDSTIAANLTVDTLIVDNGSFTGTLDATGLTSDQLIYLSGVVTAITKQHLQNTDTGTSASTFYVDTDNTNEAVLTSPIAPPVVPKNLILTTGIMGVTSGSLIRGIDVDPSFDLDDGWDSSPSKAWVFAKWGLEGTGVWDGSNSFEVANVPDIETDQYNPVGDISYTLYYDGVHYNIVTSGADHVTVTDGLSSGSGPFIIGSNAQEYKIRVVQLETNGAERADTAKEYTASSGGTGPTEQKRIFGNLDPGLNYSFALRSINGFTAASQSGYSASASIIAGNVSALTMSPITVAPIQGGVRITIPRVTGAAAYRAVYTTDGSVPDRNNLNQPKTPASPSLSIEIIAPPGDKVRVAVWAIDQLGNRTSTTDNGTGTTAGGGVLGKNSNTIRLSNGFSMTSSDTSESDRKFGSYRLDISSTITEIAFEVVTLNLSGATDAVIRVYNQSDKSNALIFTFNQNGKVVQPFTDVFFEAGWIQVDSWNVGMTSPWVSFHADVFMTFIHGDVRNGLLDK